MPTKRSLVLHKSLGSGWELVEGQTRKNLTVVNSSTTSDSDDDTSLLLLSSSISSLSPPIVEQDDIIIRYQLNMKPASPVISFRAVIVTAAVGYTRMEEYTNFVGTLRNYYNGDVIMLISSNTSNKIRNYLQQHHIMTTETTLKGGVTNGQDWEDLNRYRFQFFKASCTSSSNDRNDYYDWCLAIDFRDTLFQANPFDWPTLGQQRIPYTAAHAHDTSMSDTTTATHQQPKDLYFFNHNKKKLAWNIHVASGRWHTQSLKRCGAYKTYYTHLTKKPIINAGGFLGTPTAVAAVYDSIMNDPTLRKCNDQVALNAGIYGGLLSQRNITYTILDQGYGPISNVAFKGIFTRDGLERFGGRDCFLSPVVHQYDRGDLRFPLNHWCGGEDVMKVRYSNKKL